MMNQTITHVKSYVFACQVESANTRKFVIFYYKVIQVSWKIRKFAKKI